MSQRYSSLPINIPPSIWKYENGWENERENGSNKNDKFKIDDTKEEMIKTLVNKDYLEDGEILEITDDELPPLVSYSYTSDSEISNSETSNSETSNSEISDSEISDSDDADGLSEAIEKLKDTKELEKQLQNTKKLLEQSYQNHNYELTNVASAWHQYSYQLECEINRKEQVIQRKDNKATRLINIIRDKNRELDEINNKYNTLSKSLDMIREIVNPGHKKPQLNEVFTDYIEFVRDKLYQTFDHSFNKVDDLNNKEKFKTFIYNIHEQYLEQVSPNITNLKLDQDNKKKVMENFMAYMKYIDSMTNSHVDYSGGSWNGTLEELCQETITMCFPYNASFNGW